MQPFPRVLAAVLIAARPAALRAAVCPPDPAEPGSAFRRARCDTDSPREVPDAFAEAHAMQLAYPALPRDARFRAVLPSVRPAPALVHRGAPSVSPDWHLLGPAGVEGTASTASFLSRNVSGRATAIVLAPRCSAASCRAWLGSAGGGVWRTERALDPESAITWRHLSGGLVGNTIGALALDPNDPSGNTIFAGTGEANFNFTSGAGTGIYRSTDGGETWSRLDTQIADAEVSTSPIDFTASRGISRIVVAPGQPGTIYVATGYALAGMTAVRGGQDVVIGRPQARVGLYRSRDGGATWALLWAAPLAAEEATAGLPPGARLRSQGVKDLVLDPRDPETIYVSAFNAGVFRSSPRLEGGDASFKPVFALIGASSGETAAAAIAIAVHDGRTRVWAGNGVADRDAQGVYRADDADVPASALATDTGAGVVDLPVWHDVTSGDPDAPGYATHAFCGSQCGYDQVLAAPPGAPDTIYVGGSAGGLLGDPVVRSADAGETFSSFGFDAAADVGLLHGDIHAIAFDPDDPSIVFVASDGGLARSSGDLADGSALCTSATLGFAPDDPDLPACVRMLTAVPERFLFLNRGLATLQFYSVAADPRDPLGHVLGGTQDNATVALDPAAGRWSWLLPVGDGVAGGFHPTRTDVVFAGANDLNFYTLEDAGPGTGTWVWTSGPIRASEEATSISPMFTGRQFFTIDPARPDTQFTGAEHVWRTTDDGGDPGFLEAHCVLFAIDHDFRDQCGDWTPLGRKLTDASWGDREGGVVAAAARTAGDWGTLWAATSTGRLFVSRNADAPDPAAVAFRRIDSPLSAAPNRFPSAIVADPAEPRRAWIAYSGFNALTPDRPGHVFEVTIAADGSSVQWISLDANLGDLPIDHLVRDDRTGDLYAATDFGVLVRGAANGAWAPAGTGLPDVLTPFLEILPADRLLLAATHGLGIWYRRLPPAP